MSADLIPLYHLEELIGWYPYEDLKPRQWRGELRFVFGLKQTIRRAICTGQPASNHVPFEDLIDARIPQAQANRTVFLERLPNARRCWSHRRLAVN